jgi:peptidoglycan/xylan/chitin deacetylase (PgdA/CDA1 family)
MENGRFLMMPRWLAGHPSAAPAERQVSFHVDLDSPLRLMEFYGLPPTSYSDCQLGSYYSRALERALRFFDRNGIKVTLFVVGDDLRRSAEFRTMAAAAHREGHELANHTFSHPFGLAALAEDAVRTEIMACDGLIAQIVGQRPVGFRAPGYDISARVMDFLEGAGYQYDSSGFWSVLTPLAKAVHRLRAKSRVVHAGYGGASWALPREPYFPRRDNWLMKGPERGIMELPLPTDMVGLPFYSNFHLLFPECVLRSRMLTPRRTYLVYLMHIVEFADTRDVIPHCLSMHPNAKMPFEKKLARLDILVKRMLASHRCVLSRDYTRDGAPGRRCGGAPQNAQVDGSAGAIERAPGWQRAC